MIELIIFRLKKRPSHELKNIQDMFLQRRSALFLVTKIFETENKNM